MAKNRELGHGFDDDDLDDGGDDDGEDARQAAQDSPHHLTRPHTGHLVHRGVEQFTWNCVNGVIFLSNKSGTESHIRQSLSWVSCDAIHCWGRTESRMASGDQIMRR